MKKQTHILPHGYEIDCPMCGLAAWVSTIGDHHFATHKDVDGEECIASRKSVSKQTAERWAKGNQ